MTSRVEDGEALPPVKAGEAWYERESADTKNERLLIFDTAGKLAHACRPAQEPQAVELVRRLNSPSPWGVKFLIAAVFGGEPSAKAEARAERES